MAGVKVPFVDLVAQHEALRQPLLDAVAGVLSHGQFILGPELRSLEADLRGRTGAKHAFGVASCTDALRLALQLHGVGPGDEVLTVSHSFFATATAIALVGATPRFVDVDPDTLLMDPDKLPGLLTPRTRAVMPVHLCGVPCDMAAITAFCEAHGLALIEDCAQAIGARYRGQHVGTFGTGAFSFHPLKTLSACGDAGLITLRDDAQATRLQRLRNLGLRDRDHCDEVSAHSRLDTLQAAILGVKLKHLDDWLDARRAHASAYAEGLRGVYPLMGVPEGGEPAPTTYVIRHPERDGLIAAMAGAGFDLKVHYPVAIHRQAAFSRYATDPLPVTERISGEIISLPCSPELAPGDRDRLIDALRAHVGA